MTNDHPLPLTPDEEAAYRATLETPYGDDRWPSNTVRRLLATLDAVRSDQDELDALATAWEESARMQGERVQYGDPSATLAGIRTLERCAAALRALAARLSSQGTT